MGVSDKSTGDTISFSDINDEIGNASNATLSMKTAGDSFDGISSDGVYSINEFYGVSDASPAFSSFTAAGNASTTGRIDINWGTSGPVNTFLLKRATNSDMDANVASVSTTNDGSESDTGLSNTTNDGVYFYQATATNTDPNPDNSTNSSVVSATLLPTVTSPSATANTGIGGRIDLAWTNNGTITQVVVKRADNSGMSTNLATILTDTSDPFATSFADTGQSGTKYYRIDITNATGTTNSSVVNATATSAIARTIEQGLRYGKDGESDETVFGWATNELILCVEDTNSATNPSFGTPDSLEDTISYALTTTSGGWNNGSVAKLQSDGTTVFDGDARFWRNNTDEKIHQIAANGVISNTINYKPATLSISQVSKTDTQIVVQASGDFRVAKTLRWLISPDASSQNNTTTTNHSKGSTSDNSNTYNRTFTGLSANTGYTIQVRGENAEDEGTYASVSITTDSTPVTSFSVVNNTGLTLSGDAGDTGTSTSDAEITLSNGSGGCSGVITTTGGPFGNFTIAVASTGDPGTGGSTGDGTGFLTQTNINLNAMYTNWNSGTRYHRTRWQHTPSNRDGSGAYTWTITNNSVTTTITGNINFGLGQLCIYENILVNTPSGKSNINDLQVGDMVKSWNFKTKEVEEVPILDIIKPIHNDLIKVSLEDPNQEDWLNEIILTTDHPIYKQDGTLVSRTPDLSKSRYNVETNTLKVNDYITMLDEKYYARVSKVEDFEGEHNTYTILTKNNNFYAGDILVHSEVEV
jgi:hypothetical protein